MKKLSISRPYCSLFVLCLLSFNLSFAQSKIGTSKIWGTVDDIDIEGKVEGPSTEVTPLQIACVFEYTEGDIFKSPPALPEAVNGMVHLDKSLNGLITELRKSGKFSGHSLETLLITPPAHTIGAKQLLLIGLGDRNKFKPDLMLQVATVGMEEALRLGVTEYAFASDLKDAGIDSPTADVAGYGVTGAVKAYRTQTFLKEKNMSKVKPIKKITLLAGPAFFETAGTGIISAISTLKTTN
ncbi:MAG: peptidase M17 [Pseudopedobacter saltans]|uniref:Peptidase M17 n=1 Tax=Pseudopedobacter saltans TaxID=151895 RepID=A0A2W5EZT4_9SPHI|nr:MAG: peptidase M17 [Pseudopedobacter saltans]